MIADPTLLVVDDEQVYCDGCERIFSRQGFHVEGSNDAEEALDLAKQNNYAAIILDVKMPNMDGIRFLEHLRAMKPDTPVILMTGYPSIQNAASAIRLGASDYVTKPFTPEQITSAVRSLLHTEGTDDSEPQTSQQTTEESPDAGSADLAFFGRAWANLSDRAAVRVGGAVPRPDSTLAELRLPRVGDIVHQGLPLFAVADNDGFMTTVPAPVTGMVLEVNSALETNPELLWEHPCGLGWIAKIAPTRLEREETRLKSRKVVAATTNRDFAGFYRDKLTNLGCTVLDADPTDTGSLLRSAKATGIVLLDAASCGDVGPHAVGGLLEKLPETKIVVVAPEGTPQQDDFRAQRLFYYAVPPLEDSEILDIVDSCYRPPTSRRTAPVPSSQNLPISALHVDTDAGQRVTMLVPDGLLERETGLGLILRNKLLERLLPLETGLGNLKMTPTRVLREAAKSDRVIILMTSDTLRIPGSLASHRHGSLTPFVGVEIENGCVLAIESKAATAAIPKLDTATLDALAEHIVDEIMG